MLSPPPLIRDPLPLSSRIIKVEHRGDRVDAKRVKVERLEPMEGA
jgi:hypothetical protein